MHDLGRHGRPLISNSLRTVDPALSAARAAAGRRGAAARWASRPTGHVASSDGNRAGNLPGDSGDPRAVRAAHLRQGRTDWYRISNQAGDGGPAVIDIYDEIGYFGVTAADFVAELRQITASEIELHLNTPGGDVYDGIAIYNALIAHQASVTVQVDALAASAGSFIAQAGDRVIMTANAQMMIHDAFGLCIGNATDMRQMAEQLDMHSDNIASIYAERAGNGGVKTWRKRMAAETWYSADEAVSAGLADEVQSAGRRRSESAANQWDLSVFRYGGRNQAPAPDLGGARARQPVRRLVDMACPMHHTATTDEGEWDAGAQQGRLDSPMTVATARAMYGYYDGDQVDDGEVVKAACKLPHHVVSDDGTPGAAHLAGVRNALARLPQSDIPEGEHEAIRRHLQAHLDDADDGGADDGGADDRADPPAAIGEDLQVFDGLEFDPRQIVAGILDAAETSLGADVEAQRAAIAEVPDWDPDAFRAAVFEAANNAPAPPSIPPPPVSPPRHVRIEDFAEALREAIIQ